jgi:hypothetical protein
VSLLAGAGVAAAMLLATLASRHASPAEVSPVTPGGAWNDVWVWSLVAALVLYTAGAALAYRRRTRLAVVVALAVVTQALPLAAPLLLSKDAYLYWGYARIVTVHHASPYRATPSDYPRDPDLPYVSEAWRGETSVYGPAFTAVSTVPAAVAGTSADRAQLGYRALAFAGILAGLALIALRTRNAAAVALVGWNPLIALHYAGGGHSDAWMIALIVLALLARKTATAGGAWALAGAFKTILPAMLLPLELAAARRLPRRFWLALVGVALVVAAAATAAFGRGWISAQLAGAHISSPLGGVHWAMEAGLTHREAVVACGLVFLAVYGVLLVHAWRTGRARLSLAASALCLLSSLLRPWYVLWPVALAAAELDVVGAAVGVALTFYLLLGDAVQL